MKEEAKNISSLSNRYLSLVLWQIKTKKSFSFILRREIKNVVQQAFMIVYRTKKHQGTIFFTTISKCSYKSTFSHLIFNLKTTLILEVKKNPFRRTEWIYTFLYYRLQNNFCSIGILIF